jgi:shikimate dehydrogenase
MTGGPGPDETPISAELIPPDALVCDLVYNPRETPLLREAASAGARSLGGLPMLVYQGAASFEIWTGVAAPAQVMFAAAEAALAARQAARS